MDHHWPASGTQSLTINQQLFNGGFLKKGIPPDHPSIYRLFLANNSNNSGQSWMMVGVTFGDNGYQPSSIIYLQMTIDNG